MADADAGVYAVSIPSETQIALECEIFVDVDEEVKWKYVSKESMEIDLELHEDDSCFSRVREQIKMFPKPEILILYSGRENDFYLFLSEASERRILERIRKEAEKSHKKAEGKLVKYPKERQSLGSEQEIDLENARNTRPLFEMDVEARYPIMGTKVKFKFRLAEDVRDGYAEFKYPSTYKASNVQRRTVDAAVQIKNQCVTKSTQTYCTYPKDQYTQYTYEFTGTEEIPSKLQTDFVKFASTKLSRMLEWISFNGTLDLHRSDYQLLMKPNNPFQKTLSNMKLREKLAFQELDICKNKPIADASWHYSKSGVVATAHVKKPFNTMITKTIESQQQWLLDDVKAAFLWSTCDELNYKLRLDAPREVNKLICCPFNENLIIGGLVNGQVVLWDISHKLAIVENEEILTSNQILYRRKMFALMSWMKNVKDTTIVSVKALSDLSASHTDAITFLEWVPANYGFSPSGHVVRQRDGKRSLQFMTASLDGTLLIWDLQKHGSGARKSRRQLHRLKEMPMGLIEDESPFRSLHRNLRPIFKIVLADPISGLMIPITCASMTTMTLSYESVGHEDRGTGTRYYYKPVLDDKSEDLFEQEIVIGTCRGEFVNGSWAGFDYISALMTENVSIHNMAQYHDGPISTIAKWKHDQNIVLTTGGKTFAVWHMNYVGKPLLWRKGKHTYCNGNWGTFGTGLIILTTMVGYVEYYNLGFCSYKHIYETKLDAKFINLHSLPRLPIDTYLVGYGDSKGLFRVFSVPHVPISEDMSKGKFGKFITKTMKIKTKYDKWQHQWKQANETKVEEAETQPADEPKKTRSLLTSSKAKARSTVLFDDKTAEFIKLQTDMIMTSYLQKQNINLEELRNQQMPLIRLRQDQMKVKKKQKQRLANADRIYHENIALMFPEVLRKTPPEPIDPYAGGDSANRKQQCYNEFDRVASEAKKIIEDNPFVQVIRWNNLLHLGYERRRKLEEYYDPSRHRERFANRTRSASELSITGSVGHIYVETAEKSHVDILF